MCLPEELVPKIAQLLIGQVQLHSSLLTSTVSLVRRYDTQLTSDSVCLTGTVATLCSLPNLTAVNLDQQTLSGSLPPCLGDLKQLGTFALARNYIDGMSLVACLLLLCILCPIGEIPGSFNKLTRLETLFLFTNRLRCNAPGLDEAGHLGKGTFKGIYFPAFEFLNQQLVKASAVALTDTLFDRIQKLVPKETNTVTRPPPHSVAHRLRCKHAFVHTVDSNKSCGPRTASASTQQTQPGQA